MNSTISSALIVDDDAVTRHLLKGLLQSEGYEVVTATSGEEAMAQIERREFPIIISDIQMDGLNGLTLLSHLKQKNVRSIVILITGYGSLEGAMEAIQVGAFDYLSKPVRPEELKIVMRRALSHWHWTTGPKDKVVTPLTLEPSKGLIGRSPKMVEVYKMIAKASISGSNVLIVGESGTGKELVARAIHSNSGLKHNRFVTVNCSALTDTLLESELFGHVKGSFTGAIANKQGLFEEADKGTIFLDEIGDISPALQVKLLRVLQEGEFKPVGSNEVKRVTTRVIAATHRNLEERVSQGLFREDLLYRLKILLIELPPLRDRLEDISHLISHFVALFSKRMRKPVVGVSDAAMRKLKSYHWPGNIRELEHAIERAVAFTNTSLIHAEDLHLRTIKAENESLDDQPESGRSLEDLERKHIIETLESVSFNKSKAALALGIDRATLYRKAQRYGIDLVERSSQKIRVRNGVKA